jgi:chromosome segregation ATPase
VSLEKAELKLKIAELTESLADVRIRAVGIQELIHEKDAVIKRLTELLKGGDSQLAKLAEECIKILQLLNELPENVEELFANQIAHSIQIDDARTKYFLDILCEREFVKYLVDMDSGTQYYISKNGRKYLYEQT